jgi:hypothetical protein
MMRVAPVMNSAAPIMRAITEEHVDEQHELGDVGT